MYCVLRLGLLGTLNVTDSHEVYARDIPAAVKFIYAKLGPLDQAKHIGGHYRGICCVVDLAVLARRRARTGFPPRLGKRGYGGAPPDLLFPV